MIVYGIIDSAGCHIDISKTEKGAKRYATLHRYTQVSQRNANSYCPFIIAEKRGKRWNRGH